LFFEIAFNLLHYAFKFSALTIALFFEIAFKPSALHLQTLNLKIALFFNLRLNLMPYAFKPSTLK